MAYGRKTAGSPRDTAVNLYTTEQHRKRLEHLQYKWSSPENRMTLTDALEKAIDLAYARQKVGK